MENLIHLKPSNEPSKDSNISSNENIADWIALYWSISKRFRQKPGSIDNNRD